MDAIETITGPTTVLMRDDIDTDQIIPAKYLKRIERTGYGEFLFEEWRKKGLELAVNPVLVAGENFGCGSSPASAAPRPRTATSRAARAAADGPIC